MEHTTYTSHRAPLPDVWRPLASSWPGFVRALTIAHEVDPDGLVTTIRQYGLDTSETVAFVRRAVNRDMGKGRDMAAVAGRSNRRRTCERCKGRWAVTRSKHCSECQRELRQRNPDCQGCGAPLLPDRPLLTRYCSDRCYHRHWREKRKESCHTIRYTESV